MYNYIYIITINKYKLLTIPYFIQTISNLEYSNIDEERKKNQINLCNYIIVMLQLSLYHSSWEWKNDTSSCGSSVINLMTRAPDI